MFESWMRLSERVWKTRLSNFDASLIASWMAAYAYSPEEQIRQTQFRQDLVDKWQIQAGDKVLEIGCGQGDTTAVLAAAVGPMGKVVGVDVASPSYGAPVNLGDSAAKLRKSPVGSQIDFRFEFRDWDSLPNDFDVAVMALCSWYIFERSELLEILKQLRKRAKRLCFAEWEVRVIHPMQSGHALAVKFQQDLGTFGFPEQLNIKSAWTTQDLRDMIQEAGWAAQEIREFPEPGLADGKWEMETCLALDAVKLGIPPEGIDAFGFFQDWIRESFDQDQCLPIFSIVAE